MGCPRWPQPEGDLHRQSLLLPSLIILKWHLEQVNGNHWAFKNVGNGRYLGVGGQPGDGTPLVAVDNSVGWDIWPDEKDNSVYRQAVIGSHCHHASH